MKGHFNFLLFLITLSAMAALRLDAQVRGSVFRDFNGNGTRESNEPLVPGVIINVYDASNALCGTATSGGATAPNYSVPGCGTGSVRVEFIVPNTPTVCVNKNLDGLAHGNGTALSDVRFVNGNSTNVNFGIIDPTQYYPSSSGIEVFIPCYANGDPLPPGSPCGAIDWFVGFPYTSSGLTPPARKLNGAIIGANWGTAYSKQAEKIFTAAFLKRHVGLGTLGTGGIYMLTPTGTTFTVTPFYDMDANGHRTRAAASAVPYGSGSSFNINPAGTIATFLGPVDPLTGQPEGLGVVGSNSARDLPTALSTPSFDPAAFDQTGKVGLGDLEISDDGRFLFVMNLYSRRLFRLELDNPSNPTSVVNVQSYPIPAVSCNNGVLRPFAVKYYRDKVYIGAVCSGENGGQNIVNGATDLYAYVFKLDDPTGGAPSFDPAPVITFPLNYLKGSADGGLSNRWYPWTDEAGYYTAVTLCRARPSPILSNIEFSDRGDLMLNFMDRHGNQFGHFNRMYLSSVNLTLADAVIGGEILIAGVDCNGTYTLENNAQITSIGGLVISTLGASNLQGPGNGEFFYGDGAVHLESSMGGFAVLPGANEFITTFMDPIGVWSGGTRRLSTLTGAGTSGYQLYSGLSGKANGLGDAELNAFYPDVPIEIGNRVWNDANGNGIQDADEPGLAGVNVTLWKETSPGNFTAIAGVLTDANGQYIFSSAPGASTDGITRGVTQLQPNMNYELRFPASVGGLNLTMPNNGGLDPNADVRDSDADAAGVIPFTTGSAGRNSHSFDVGYGCGVPVCRVTTVVKN
ncbi:MAG: SdrD B-like domain-containing protein [Saprospiraceae bacterium]